MRNVIIYSGSDLIRFALKQIIESIILPVTGSGNYTIKICSNLSEFEAVLIIYFNPVIIFDIDNISMFDQFIFDKLIDNMARKKSLILYSKECELSEYYLFSKIIRFCLSL